MESPDEKFNYGFVEDLDRAIEKGTKNPTCLYPGCSNPPIGSHVIARRTLQLIAENSHVLTWLIPTSWEMVHAHQEGIPLEQPGQEPASVGIRNKRKVTIPLYCKEHDHKIFAPLETQEFAFHPEQVLLLAYRASCTLTFPHASLPEAILEVARKHHYAHSLDTPERLQKLERFRAVQCVIDARQRYTAIYQSQDYNQLRWVTYLVNIPMCIAATYTLVPIVDENGAQAIVNGTLLLTAEDVVTFSLLPYPPANKSLCVISWLKGSQRAEQFMALSRIPELSPNEQPDTFLFYAFESPTLYIAPVWWRALSEERREEYRQIHLKTGRDHAELV
ncbi:MAG TPA: hypothetical protein VKT82_01630 [Ktedonobacterales bacterium]|nr:hypothetical protein [Ktedonobacterales bacterium]